MWFLGYIASLLVSFWLVRYYAERKTHWGIMFIVAFSWALGFSYFLVLPFDIAGAMCRACNVGEQTLNSPVSDTFEGGMGGCACFPVMGLEMLSDIIPALYVATILCGYLMNDLLRSYLDSGEFTRRGRLQDALKDAAIFYVPAILIGLVFLVYMIVHTGLNFDMVRGLCRGIINMIGLFLLIAFLGYGFVEVPRHLLNMANTDGQLRYAKFRVALLSEALQNARRKLEETLELVHSTDVQLRTEPHSFKHEHMAAILRKCPRPSAASGGDSGKHSTQAMRSANGGVGSSSFSPPTPPDPESGGLPRNGSPNGSAGRGRSSLGLGFGRSGGGGDGSNVTDEKLLPTTHKGLVALNLRLKRALSNEKRQRSMYELEVRKALRLQALFEPPPASSTHGLGSMGTSATPPAQQRWQSTIKPWLYRFSAAACATLSFIIIWCEGTILFDDPPFEINLSPLSFLFRYLGHTGGNLGVIILLYVPLLYCAACTYFAMFQMKLCDAVALHPQQHSDGSALLFNATYACRLGPPLCFNFLKLLHEREIARGHGTGLFVHRGQGITTYFTQTSFGNMDQIPFFSGDYFNNYAPLLIVVFAGCTLLNLGSGLLSCCAKCCPCVAAPTFSFDEDFSDTRIDHGAQILLHEKQALADGVPLGANLQLLSGATSDSEESAAARLRGAATRNTPRSRFDRLRDEGL